MWSFGIIKLHTNRLTGLFFAASFLLASVGAFYVAPGVDAQASVTPQKVTAIYDGYISVDPECATIPLKFTVEVWNVGSAGGGDYGNGTVVSEGPVCNVDSKGNATPGEYKTTTLSGTFSGGSNGVMVIVDPSQPKLDEKVLFIDGRIARLTISDGANSVHWDAQVINPEAFSGAAPLPATQPPLATQPPTATQLPAGNEPSSGNPTEPGGFNPISLLGIGGLLAGILGALLVALGIAAILIDGNRKADMPAPKPTGPKKNEPEPPQVSYTLNASSSAVDVYLGEPASVTFTALRISDAGSAVAMEATVKVIMAGSEAGLVASPGSAEGIMTCTFSLPTPRVCATQDVLAVALVDGTARARTLVKVHILPKYELELQWDDPQQLALQVDGKEALAWARVTATPPDPDATPDVLAQKVQVSLQGANTEWIRQPLAPYVQFEKQWNAIAMVHPAGSAEPGPGKPELVAEFSSGRQNLKARLPVEINQELALGAWVNGKKDADAVFQRKQAPPAWDFIEIHTYLHAPENEEKAIQPPFSIGDGPYIEATPPILEVKDHYGLADEPGRFVIQVVIKDGTDLETCFGPVPADQHMVKVKVYVRDDVGKEYYDVVTYHFRPTVTFCVHAYDNDPARPVALHSYRENVFTHEMEVVANADDCLCLAGYFMRTDLLAKTGPDPAKRLKFGDESIGEVRGFTWGNSQDQTDFGDPQVDEGQLGDGFLCFVLKSKVPLEATPERLDALHILNFQLAMRSDAYPLESDELELGVAMQLLRLRMWVVPGLVRHTSEVVAYLDMQPAGKPLEGQELILSTEAPADMSLELDDSQVGQKTYTAKEPCGAGAVKWRLCYSGITWNNMPQAEFVVRCGLEDPPDERWNSVAQINVYQNLLGLLNDLADDAPLSDLINNPDRDDLMPVLELPDPTERPWDTPENIEKNLHQFQNVMNYTREWAYISTSMPKIIRDNMYGPMYNLKSWFPPYQRKYVCSAMRRNIVDWLEKRRFKQMHEAAGDAINRLEKMNGIDFGFYAIVPAHVWAGIFPAGADRFAEYRALDPWWSQHWQPEWRHPDELLMQSDENALGVVYKALNIYLAFALIGLIPGITIGVTIQAIQSWLRGEPPDRIREIIGESGFGAWYDALQCDSDIVNTQGEYFGGIKLDVENWFQALIKDLG